MSSLWLRLSSCSRFYARKKVLFFITSMTASTDVIATRAVSAATELFVNFDFAVK